MKRLALVFAFAALAAAPAFAQQGKVQQAEGKFALKDGPGKDKAQVCVACHSLDYIPMNSRFMDKAAWTASVNKMINVFGAPIAREDVDAIASYLAENYGKK
jgi:mono/diheme cytochrome c family protein